MDSINSIIQQFSIMQWQDYLDIALVAFLIYWLFPLFRSKTSMRIAGAVAALLVLAWVTDIAHLHTLNFLLTKLMTVGFLAIIILFQPELRRMLEHLGNVKLENLLRGNKTAEGMDLVIPQVVAACESMSRQKIGALIVFARAQRLEEYFRTGTVVDAAVSAQMVRNIFYPKAPLHDGAMIIRDGRIAAAACVLPLSDSNRLSADLGTRHRAGVGMSEASDAVVVIVSEETGTISVAVDGMIKRHLAPQTLEKLLRTELGLNEDQKDPHRFRLNQKLALRGKGGKK